MSTKAKNNAKSIDAEGFYFPVGIVDEELKTFLRKRNGSKFKEADLKLDEAKRIAEFKRLLSGEGPYPRSKVIEAFFRSTFLAWENHHVPVDSDNVYVGYSPAR